MILKFDNAKLKRLVAELSLEKQILKDVTEADLTVGSALTANLRLGDQCSGLRADRYAEARLEQR
jgi:hypothetical protein